MNTFRVLVTRSDFPTEAIALLRSRGLELFFPSEELNMPRSECLRVAPGVRAIFCTSKTSVDRELMDTAGPTLRVVATDSAGFNHIDVEAAKERGIKVGHTPNLVTDATAELTVGLLLATSRRIVEGIQELLAGRWEWSPTWLGGKGLKGATVGIFGMGRIGQAVMARLAPFGVAKFLYAGRAPRPDVQDAEFVAFDRLLAESDFVIVTAALTDETRCVFNEAAFRQMKGDSIFINTSRGGLVDQEALVRALQEGRIGAAGLDVMTPEPLPRDHPLTKLKNCVLTPHIGTAVVEVEREMAVMTARNIIGGIFDEEMPAQVKI